MGRKKRDPEMQLLSAIAWSLVIGAVAFGVLVILPLYLVAMRS